MAYFLGSDAEDSGSVSLQLPLDLSSDLLFHGINDWVLVDMVRFGAHVLLSLMGAAEEWRRPTQSGPLS